MLPRRLCTLMALRSRLSSSTCNETSLPAQHCMPGCLLPGWLLTDRALLRVVEPEREGDERALAWPHTPHDTRLSKPRLQPVVELFILPVWVLPACGVGPSLTGSGLSDEGHGLPCLDLEAEALGVVGAAQHPLLRPASHRSIPWWSDWLAGWQAGGRAEEVRP